MRVSSKKRIKVPSYCYGTAVVFNPEITVSFQKERLFLIDTTKRENSMVPAKEKKKYVLAPSDKKRTMKCFLAAQSHSHSSGLPYPGICYSESSGMWLLHS
jgi:hypothetical protein